MEAELTPVRLSDGLCVLVEKEENMGQAKIRGNYETRKAEGEARLEREEQQRRDELAAREAALTPEQRASRTRAQRILAMGAGVVASAPYSIGVMRACRMLGR